MIQSTLLWHKTLFSARWLKSLYLTAFIATFEKSWQTRLENMILGQLKIGERQANCRGLWTLYSCLPQLALSFYCQKLTTRTISRYVCPVKIKSINKMCSLKGLTEKWLLYKRKYWKTAKQKMFLLLHSCYRSLLFRSWEIEKKSISTDIRGVFFLNLFIKTFNAPGKFVVEQIKLEFCAKYLRIEIWSEQT